MAKLVVIYRTPKDPAAFDAHYAATHIPLGLKNVRSLDMAEHTTRC